MLYLAIRETVLMILDIVMALGLAAVVVILALGITHQVKKKVRKYIKSYK